MPLTAAQASNLLADVSTPEQLRALIAQIDIFDSGTTTVFFSGELPNGGTARAVAEELARQDPNVRILNETEAARFLDLRTNSALRARMEVLIGGDPTVPGTSSYNFLNGTSDANGTRTPDGIWDDVSRRFAAETTGDVRIVVDRATDASRVFGAAELPELLRNTAITSIEGIPLSELRNVQTLHGANGLDAVFSRVRSVSEFNIAAGGLTATALPGGQIAVHVGEFLDPRLLDTQAYFINHPEAHARIDGYLSSLSPTERTERATITQALRTTAEGTHLSTGVRVLNRLGVFGTLFGFALAANASQEAHAAGDNERANDIMAEWAVDAAGSEIGSLVGVAIGGVALAAAAAVGVTLAAPLAGAVVLGGALIGGIFGAGGATDFYHLLSDRDANGRRDVIDRLDLLLFGPTPNLTTPLPADLDGARLTIDTPGALSELIAQAQSSIAYRYALRELNPFVVTDIDYGHHNTNGSLDLYDEQTGQGTITTQWIADRAVLLVAAMAAAARGNSQIAYSTALPTDRSYELRWIDAEGNPHILIAENAARQGGVVSTVRSQLISFGGSVNDALNGSGNQLGDHLYGGAGNDTLTGLDGADYLEGNADDDTLDGGTGADTLLGGAGNDTYRFTAGWGFDEITDTSGQDIITVTGVPGLTAPIDGSGTTRLGDNVWQTPDRNVNYTRVARQGGGFDLYITFATVNDVIVVRNWSPEHSVGITNLPTEAPAVVTDYTLVGDSGDNGHNYGDWDYDPDASSVTMLGLGGADWLWSSYGRYVVPLDHPSYTPEWAAAQTDFLDGGTEDDSLYGADGRDTLVGGDGEDYLVGGVWFGPDAVHLYEELFGFDELAPQAFVDTHLPQWRRELDANMLEGGAGNDTMHGGWGDDAMYGGADHDWMWGSVGDDMIFGGDGDDVAHGDGTATWRVAGGFHPHYVPVYLQGDDIMDGGAGNDEFGGSGGSDVVYGGTGNDTLHGDMALGPTDIYVHVPYEYQGDDWLDGGDGEDQIYGDGRDDTLIGGAGADSLWGDRTQEALYAEHHGDDVLDGGIGSDQLAGGGGSDVIDGGADADLIFGDDSADRVSGVYHRADLIDGGEGNDTIVAGGGDDNVFGSGGDDWIQGDDNDLSLATHLHGADYLDGGAGNDTVESNAGADTVNGGTGNDMLAGGTGTDTYTFATGDGVDRIDDRDSDSVIVLSGVSRAGLAATTVQQSDGLGGTMPSLQLRYGANDIITFDGGLGRGFAQLVLDDGSTMTRAEVMGLVSQDLVINGDVDFFANSDSLVGGGGNDAINGGSGNDTLQGGAGINVITGGSGNDTYEFSQSGGVDRIDNRAGDHAITTDAVRFADGITTGMVAFQPLGDDLVVRAGSSASMTLLDHFAVGAEAQRVDEFRFADGTTWSAAQVDATLTQGSPTSASDLLTGTAGNDTLVALAGNDTLAGNAGNDVLDGGVGNDSYHVLSTSSGEDTIVEHAADGAAGDVILVGAGVVPGQVDYLASSSVYGVDNNDVIGYVGEGANLGLRTPWSSVEVRGFFLTDNLTQSIDEVRFAEGSVWTAQQLWDWVRLRYGTGPSASDDEVYGTTNADTVDGLAGHDWLRGYAGADVLGGGAGDDHLFGHAGNDTLTGGTGQDTLYGGAGDNVYVFNAGDGVDWIHARLSHDLGGTDVLRLGAGISADTVTLSRPYYEQMGGNRVSMLDNVTLSFGSTGDSVTLGGWLQGPGYAVQRIEFADGTVWTTQDLIARLGSLRYQPDVQMYLGAWASPEGTWHVTPPGTGAATGPDDRVWGTGFGDALSTGSGDDTLDGLTGNDTLTGGLGADWLRGSTGDDEYVFGVGHGADFVEDTEGRNVLRFDASVTPGAASFQEVNGGVLVRYDGGRVQVDDWSAIDRIEFADGSSIRAADVMLLPAGQGTPFDDELGGTPGPDLVDGQGGNDAISGADGDDALRGGTGVDTLYGDAGRDVLDGGAGDDELLGGAGQDVYVFDSGSGADVVVDTVSGTTDASVIRFGPGVLPGDVTVSITDGTWRLTTAAGDSVVLGTSVDPVDPTFLDRVPVLRIEFADATVWDQAAILARVQASYAAAGTQLVFGTSGADALTGSAGDDTLLSFDGADTLMGADGADALVAGGGADVLMGGAGSDDLDGAEGIDTLSGGAGDDAMRGGQGADRYEFGGAFGRDRLQEIANGEVNEVHFSDRLASQIYVSRDAWSTYLIDSTTNDQVVLSGTWETGSPNLDPWRITFADGTVWTPADVQAATDLRRVSAGADVWFGTDAAEVVDAGQGDDALTGNGGHDVLHGGDGNDILDDASGTNLLDGGAGVDDILITGGAAVVVGGQGNDYVSVYDDASLPTAALVLVNAGDGYDDIYIAAPVVTTISVGGGLTPEQATIRNGAGFDPVLDFGGHLQLTVYGNSTEPLVLQIVQAGSVTTYDLRAVLADFEAALDADPELLEWSAQSSLQAHALTTSSTTAIGGALAYRYAVDGSLTSMPDAAIQALLAQPGFGSVAQTIAAAPIVGTEAADQLVGTAQADDITGLGGNDTLDGGAGVDTLRGGAGDDMYVVDQAADVVIEDVGEGTDTVRASVTTTLAANAERLELTGSTAIDGTGNSLDNTLIGNAAANQLVGGAGADTLDGSTGNDTMLGGAGNDTYVADAAGDVVTENINEGIDTMQSAVTWTLGANIENLTLTGTGAINATGNDGNNVLTGNTGANVLFGGLGDDTYVVTAGGAADTIADTGGAADRIELASVFTAAITTLTRSGNDVLLAFAGRPETLRLSNWFVGAANQVESIVFTDGTVWNAAYVNANTSSVINGTAAAETLTGTAADDQINGLGGNDTLVGNAGHDSLDGGAGNDSMRGGAGNDTYVVDSTTDIVVENAGEGTDTVRSAVTWTLGTNVENLTLTGTSAINGTGNTLANVITGNAGSNALNGGTGADTLVGGAGNDSYTVDNVGDVITEAGAEGTDTVTSSVTYTLAVNVENLTLSGTSAIHGTGNADNNSLTGNSANNNLAGGAGNDTINGGTGNDTMVGGTGNDTYVVNVATDVVTELADEGTDTVQSSATLTLGANVENLTLTGTSALSGTGNTLANVLTGNSAANRLTGGAGNDTLDGGTGNDTMVGGVGDDTYVVNVTTDVVTENANEGIDTVMSAVTLTLTSTNLENLTLSGTSAINATGNANANVLIGNSAANTLAGLGGNDTYDGGAGNDTMTDNSTTSSDIYRWGTGVGSDVINDAGGSADRIEMAAGITQGQVTLTRSGNNLVVTIGGAANTLTVNNWYASTANRVEEIRLADGSVMNLGSTAPLSAVAASLIVSDPASGGSTAMLAFDGGSASRGRVPALGGYLGGRRDRIIFGDIGVDQQANVLVDAMTTFDSQPGATVGIVHRAPPREPVWTVPAA